MNLKTICNPAKLWFALSLLCAFYMLYSGFNLVMVLIRLFYAFIWTIVIGLMCRNEMYTMSWSLVVLPIIYIFFM